MVCIGYKCYRCSSLCVKRHCSSKILIRSQFASRIGKLLTHAWPVKTHTHTHIHKYNLSCYAANEVNREKGILARKSQGGQWRENSPCPCEGSMHHLPRLLIDTQASSGPPSLPPLSGSRYSPFNWCIKRREREREMNRKRERVTVKEDGKPTFLSTTKDRDWWSKIARDREWERKMERERERREE